MNHSTARDIRSLDEENPVTVVIVDDEAEICERLGILFEASGLIDVVAVGYSGEDAVKLAAEWNPEVMLLDLHFPQGINGFKLDGHAAQGMGQGVVQFAGQPVALAADGELFQGSGVMGQPGVSLG